MVTWTMNDNEKLNDIIKQDLDVRADERTYTHMRDIVLAAHEHPTGTESATTLIHTGRPIMKNPITKLALAAAVIAAVVLGLFEFISADAGSGVIWAEVAQKVEASQGVIYRERHGTENQHARTIESDYGITYLSPTQYRAESFKDGQCWITMYDNRATAKRVVLLHAQKEYALEDITLTDEGDRKHANYQDPTYWVRKFMACKYTELKPQEIDGVLCEGIETTDLALIEGESETNSLVARLWVSVETGYPVLLEGEFSGEVRRTMVHDQFQWDVEFDPDVFEPSIPAEYEQM